MASARKVERMQELLRSLADKAPVCEACTIERARARQKWIDDARAMLAEPETTEAAR